MIPQDIINRVQTAHDNAVEAAQLWSEAAAKKHKTETLWGRYQRAEEKFERAMFRLVESNTQ